MSVTVQRDTREQTANRPLLPMRCFLIETPVIIIQVQHEGTVYVVSVIGVLL